jgi:hypothetical protein
MRSTRFVPARPAAEKDPAHCSRSPHSVRRIPARRCSAAGEKAGTPGDRPTNRRRPARERRRDPCEVPTSFERRKPHSAPHPHGACRSARLPFDQMASAFAPALRRPTTLRRSNKDDCDTENGDCTNDKRQQIRPTFLVLCVQLNLICARAIGGFQFRHRRE